MTPTDPDLEDPRMRYRLNAVVEIDGDGLADYRRLYPDLSGVSDDPAEWASEQIAELVQLPTSDGDDRSLTPAFVVGPVELKPFWPATPEEREAEADYGDLASSIIWYPIYADDGATILCRNCRGAFEAHDMSDGLCAALDNIERQLDQEDPDHA